MLQLCTHFGNSLTLLLPSSVPVKCLHSALASRSRYTVLRPSLYLHNSSVLYSGWKPSRPLQYSVRTRKTSFFCAQFGKATGCFPAPYLPVDRICLYLLEEANRSYRDLSVPSEHNCSALVSTIEQVSFKTSSTPGSPPRERRCSAIAPRAEPVSR